MSSTFEKFGKLTIERRENGQMLIHGIPPKEIADTHPGFSITCDKCNGKRVIVDNSVGWSEASGQWGSVDLRCLDCGASTSVYGD
jgi:hypothetical protein